MSHFSSEVAVIVALMQSISERHSVRVLLLSMFCAFSFIASTIVWGVSRLSEIVGVPQELRSSPTQGRRFVALSAVPMLLPTAGAYTVPSPSMFIVSENSVLRLLCRHIFIIFFSSKQKNKGGNYVQL